MWPYGDPHRRLIHPIVIENKSNSRLLFSMTNQHFVIRSSKRTKCRHVTDRFEKIRFPLPVRADEKLPPSGKIKRSKGNIAKILDRDLLQNHRPIDLSPKANSANLIKTECRSPQRANRVFSLPPKNPPLEIAFPFSSRFFYRRTDSRLFGFPARTRPRRLRSKFPAPSYQQ